MSLTLSPVQIEGGCQIGGGSGYVAGRIREAAEAAQNALASLRSDWGKAPKVGPHPREAALEASREAVIILNEALSIECPEDAVIDTRHALEALAGSIAKLERLGNQPGDPNAKPVSGYVQAINFLITAEAKLARYTGPMESQTLGLQAQFLMSDDRPVEPTIPPSKDEPKYPPAPNGNPGVVPPWLLNS